MQTEGDQTMIVMDIKLDNFLAFNNFHMNMSYPKKIVNSSIENEHLADRANFRYKKVNILMGGNATGKTTLGKMIMLIFNFIERKAYDYIAQCINDKSQKATFTIDFVMTQNDLDLDSDFNFNINLTHRLYRVHTEIRVREEKKMREVDVLTFVNFVNIDANDSYEVCAKKLTHAAKESKNDVKQNYIEELEKVGGLTWLFRYPEEERVGTNLPDSYEKILDYTLRSLDPAIIKVEKLTEVEKSYAIRIKNADPVILQEGSDIPKEPLSSGTKAGIDIAFVLSEIKKKPSRFYYCDEKFSYIHSDIEKAFLSLMISCLGENSQLFFTTHNFSILDLDLPKHSYTFLKKDMDDEEQSIKCINASQYLKKNTQSLRNAVENDLFSVAPNLDLIYEIEEL